MRSKKMRLFVSILLVSIFAIFEFNNIIQEKEIWGTVKITHSESSKIFRILNDMEIKPSHIALSPDQAWLDPGFTVYDLVDNQGNTFKFVLEDTDKNFCALLDQRGTLLYGIINSKKAADHSFD